MQLLSLKVQNSIVAEYMSFIRIVCVCVCVCVLPCVQVPGVYI